MTPASTTRQWRGKLIGYMAIGLGLIASIVWGAFLAWEVVSLTSRAAAAIPLTWHGLAQTESEGANAQGCCHGHRLQRL